MELAAGAEAGVPGHGNRRGRAFCVLDEQQGALRRRDVFVAPTCRNARPVRPICASVCVRC